MWGRQTNEQMAGTNQQQMKQTFIVASLMLIIGVLAFTGMMNISSFRHQYVTSLMNSQSVVVGETVRKIEFAVKYGKPLENFHGMTPLLEEIRGQLPGIQQVEIYSSAGEALYALENITLPENMKPRAVFPEKPSQAYVYGLEEGVYHQFFPIFNQDGQPIGSLGLAFSENLVDQRVRPYLYQQGRNLLLLVCLATLALIFLSGKKSPVTAAGHIDRKILLWLMVGVIGSAQIIYGFLNYRMFQEAYLTQTRDNTAAVASIIEKDVKTVLDKGVGYHQFYQMDQYLANIANSLPEVEGIRMIQNDRIVHGMTPEEAGSAWKPGEEATGLALPEGAGEVSGMSLQVTISQEYLRNQLRELLLDTLTVLVTSTFFMVELTFFLMVWLSRKKKPTSVGEKTRQMEEIPVGEEIWQAEEALQGKEHLMAEDQTLDALVVRVLAFIVFTAIFMSSSFIPLLMKSISRPVMGLSENVIYGLPISFNFLLGALGIILAGRYIDKIGWRKTFFVGSLVLGAGTLLSGLTTNPLVFVLVRGITGAGYGFTLMAMRGCVLTLASDKFEGYASLNAGIYSGMNCGVVIGAMLADRIAYRGVFMVTVVLIALAGLYVLKFTQKPSDAEIKTPTVEEKLVKSADKKQIEPLKHFFSDKKVFLFLLGILLPAGICMMFLDYFFPLLTQEMNVPVANVGRAFLVNGVCIVYLGPLINRVLGKRLRVETLVVMGALSTIGAMAVFASVGTLMAAFVAAFLLGIADSFALVAQTNYLLGLESAKILGQGLALGYYSNVKKIGQMLGPMVFGGMITLGNQRGIGFIGAGVLVLTLAFMTTLRRSKAEPEESEIPL
ncbi:MFS transporter [Anoxynatronum buryatiense]|uniref:Predicted arabinose efflux permease, MFS family n=1 Tax=Anoxynatronum buryatiense TaxID=489973 RepID=A0AA46AJ42_9CLOT|nr:MFS transporter [Anoxynatronum buryatiense]SMP58080.1 Predicted arabinose efflux permease, MFS family [Anoxynatronum buryatiense]